MKPLKLFWCSTPTGDEDYWVAATSRNMAIAFFAQENGFELQEITAEEIRGIPAECRCFLDMVLPATSDLPRSASKLALQQLGIYYNETFHVFSYKGRIFRPEGLVRTYMQSIARGRQKLRKAL
jgi:hypothetical protein